MTMRDDGFPGNREIVERALRESTTQVLYLAAETGPRNRSLLERAAGSVRGFERVSEAPPGVRPPDAVVAASKDGIPSDIAEAYMRAKTEVKAILAEHLDVVVHDPETL
ncbi:MAG: hypothetical protein GEV28_17700 [Actinophytocola sp.]|uniref:hypothetical protein n=1 Tax=Actinophytocola sp. TaxID=1872138 RepID=UPI001325CC6A|nr:hypothetical protein [Actinophytocola sp.]MPZ82124.1 hypothetical protein [Actinophytocola sp.]